MFRDVAPPERPTETPATQDGHWLVGLRWAFLAVETLAILGSLPAHRWWYAGAILVAQIALIILFSRYTRRRTASSHLIAGVLAMDIIAFTGLLAMAGGASNPFTVAFLVYIAVSVSTLPWRLSWALVGLCVGGYGVLFIGHDPHAHHDMSRHLRDMWLGFAGTAALMAWFGGRIHAELRARSTALVNARARAARGEQLAALGALAASAAHELGTPLGTIAVANGEMAQALDDGRADDVRADIELIRTEILRARVVLDRLAHDVGYARGESIATVRLLGLLSEVVAPLDAARVEFDVAVPAFPTFPIALKRALRSIVDNALRAGPETVLVRAEAGEDHVTIAVCDRGVGMSGETLRRAAEPFFSTRDGDGMGLGLFLARSIIEQIGGTLTIESVPGQGTTVRIQLRHARDA